MLDAAEKANVEVLLLQAMERILKSSRIHDTYSVLTCQNMYQHTHVTFTFRKKEAILQI